MTDLEGRGLMPLKLNPLYSILQSEGLTGTQAWEFFLLRFLVSIKGTVSRGSKSFIQVFLDMHWSFSRYFNSFWSWYIDINFLFASMKLAYFENTWNFLQYSLHFDWRMFSSVDWLDSSLAAVTMHQQLSLSQAAFCDFTGSQADSYIHFKDQKCLRRISEEGN
jgi:hypothetical protein